MQEQRNLRSRGAGSEAGFALILSILALMLLTFLGLTLAATTSTELQIATNYRWSQQAFYNAEAGLEAAKVVLAQVSKVDADFRNVLPQARVVNWNYGVTGAAGGPPTPAPAARGGLRDYERMGCADRAGVGYGRILTATGTPDPGDYQDRSQFMGTNLNGAFTLWVRRELTVTQAGQFSDDTDNTTLVITAEGVAPYAGAQSAFTRANQARRILEVGYALLVDQGNRCQSLSGQEGLAPSGENFDPCSQVKVKSVQGAFGNAPTKDTGVR